MSTKMISVDENMDLFQEAIEAYEAYCEQHGYIFQQPGIIDSMIGRKYVHLRNSYRDLAKYDFKNRRIVE